MNFEQHNRRNGVLFFGFKLTFEITMIMLNLDTL